MKKGIALLLMLSTMLMSLTACGGENTSSQEASDSLAEESSVSEPETLIGGEMNLYTWDGMFPQEILRAFEEETGVRINYSNFDYDEDMLAKLEETQGGDYDFVIADDYILELVIAEGLAQKLDTSKLENYGNLNPVFMSQFYDPNNEYTVPYGAGIPLIVYDPALTDVEITGYVEPCPGGQCGYYCQLSCDQRHYSENHGRVL